MTRRDIEDLIRELEGFKRAADMGSRTLIRDGHEVAEADRARAEGYATAYAFCIMRLEAFLESGETRAAR